MELHKSVIERLAIRNYRILRDVTFDQLTPLTVFFGPNGSGKSTVFDAIAFLHEMFADSLAKAWMERGGIAAIRTHGQSGPVSFEIDYRDPASDRSLTYRLSIDERDGAPWVVTETLAWADGSGELLNFANGSGFVAFDGESLDWDLDSSDVTAVGGLGHVRQFPQVTALRRFIAEWHLSYLDVKEIRAESPPSARSGLTLSGRNLARVIERLQRQHPDRVESVVDTLARRIPGVEGVRVVPTPNGELEILLKDRSSDVETAARHISDGTLRLLALLILLRETSQPRIIGVEEPENQLHPRLHYVLAEEMRVASATNQLLVTTHSPHFVDALRPAEAWLLYRDGSGFAQSMRATDNPAVTATYESGASPLGRIWMQGFFGVGDPLGISGCRP